MYLKSDQLPEKKQTRAQINQRANKELAKLWLEKGIDSCEICGSTFGLTNAHKHKRAWYYNKPEKTLWDYNQVVRLCLPDHMSIEGNREKTKQVFRRLRNEK